MNNIVEQDHRFIKKRIRSMLGLKSFDTATSILSGVEAMHMIKKEQIALRNQSVQNQKEFHPSIVWTDNIRYDSVRNIYALFSFVLFLHQNHIKTTHF